jgi:hypothetical protein
VDLVESSSQVLDRKLVDYQNHFIARMTMLQHFF